MGRTSTVEYRSSLFRPEHGKGVGRGETCPHATTSTGTREHNCWPVTRAGPGHDTKLYVSLAIQNTVRVRKDQDHDTVPSQEEELELCSYLRM